MRRLSLARTLQVALLGLTVALSAIAAFGVAALTDARQDYENRLAAGLELQAAAARLLAAGVVEEATLRTAGPGTAAALRARGAYAAALDATRARTRGDDEASDTLLTQAVRGQQALRRRDAPQGAALEARAPITALVTRQRERVEQAREDTRDRQRRAVVAIVAGGSLALIAALALVAGVLAQVRRPLDALVGASGRLADGDLEARVDAERGPDELRVLGRSFNAMADDLAVAQARVEGERRRLETTIRALGDGLVLIGSDGRIASVNPRAVELFGDAAPGRTPQEAGLPSPVGGAARRAEVTVEHRGRTLALTAAELPDSDGGVVWTLRDISERARLEQLKSDFVATASHELRSPLTSIKGFVELLAASDGLSASQREFVDIVQQSSDRLVDLVDDLLDVARLEAGHVEVQRRPTDLGDVVADVVTLMRPRVAAKAQALRAEVAGDLPPALADPGRMHQIVTNLVTNAHLYTPDGGAINVAVDQVATGVRIRVADTGVGMDAEELARVFDRFVRGRRQDGTGAGAPGGSGLGLNIVRSLVELHDGQLDVSSAPGEGTVFTVTVPRADGVALGAAPSAADTHPGR